ncbi:ATP-binding protein [Amycolatopsis sp. NBC_01488]|uniref:sensor histidine kinase n=1 Tax=Amycolatopsis sp. NBC_01488 TaxID=2903563 RepID=UPI002E2DB442|nr:ATP-binding protein [Amycolatopsis sp. NBC_01488]
MHTRGVEDQVKAWLLRALTLLWAAQALPWGVLLLWPDSESSRAPAAVVPSYLVYLVWAGVLLWWLGTRSEVGAVPTAAAVVVMTGAELLVGFALPPESVATWQNWTPPPSTGVAVLAQVYGGYRWGTAAVAVLGGSYLATGLRGQGLEQAGTLLGVTGQLVVFTVAAGLVAAKLIDTARRADTEAEGALQAREAEARTRERVRQYDLLHTNVLTTLTVVSRQECLSPQIRAKCERDARYLRAVAHTITADAAPELDGALAEAVFLQGAHDLDVHYSSDRLPDALGSEAVEAVTHAVTEALNNVAKHAGTAEAWVVATGEEGGELAVTVTDHGCGFDPATTPSGTGLSHSLPARLAEVGGTVTVESHPGSGTIVEIRLPLRPTTPPPGGTTVTAPAGDQGNATEIAALGSLYQAERSENVTLLNINIALLGAVLAYAAASVAFLDKVPQLPRLGAALVPIPLWLGMLYSTLLVALQGRRGASAMAVEDALFRQTGMALSLRDRIGSKAGEYVVNPGVAPWPYRILLGVVYLVPWALVGLYTGYMLVNYVKSGAMLYWSAGGYALLLGAAGAAYLRAFRDTPKLTPSP